jgi:DNA polymerase III sliding clamp (beta) subunit (PCNA family)
VAGDFPDHRRVLDSSTSSSTRKLIPLDVPTLRSTLPRDADPVAVLSARDGHLRVVAPADWDSDDPDQFAVNPEFLLQALDAGGDGQLVLDLDGPIRPLAIRTTTDAERFSVLMPIRR